MKRFVGIVAAVLLTTSVSHSEDANIIIDNQSAYENTEVICLAKNVYFEARSSSFADQVAVTDVVMNRVESSRYPNTICDVVTQGYKKGRKDCQFSWYCDGKSDEIPNVQSNDSWMKSLDIASNMYFNRTFRGITEGATNYHATYVKPAWRHNLELVGRIGAHIFYRNK